MVLYLLIHDAKSEIFCDILKSSWDHVVWEEKLSRAFQSSRLALRLRDPPKLSGLHNRIIVTGLGLWKALRQDPNLIEDMRTGEWCVDFFENQQRKSYKLMSLIMRLLVIRLSFSIGITRILYLITPAFVFIKPEA